MARAALPDVGARQLEAVLALAEYGSFVAAAARLRISQPALTRMLKRLEMQLGVRLAASGPNPLDAHCATIPPIRLILA